MRLTQTAAERLHHLERHAYARQDGAFARGIAFGIGHGNAFGHRSARLVMVGDHHVDAVSQNRIHFVSARNAAVHRDDQRRIVAFRTRDRSGREAVSFFETLRNERNRIGAERTQSAREHRRRRNAIQVEVAEHKDATAVADGRLDTVGRLFHIGDLVGIAPVSFQVGSEKRPCLLDARNAMGRHSACDEPREPELLLKSRYKRRISRRYMELRCHNVTCLTS